MSDQKIFAVDLNSGSYTEKLTGHELFNLDRNSLDGMYYGYVPPYNNIDITKIDPNAEDVVSGVLVVYVQSIGKKDKNREIIAFCENADVYRIVQPGEEKNRYFIDSDGTRECAPYSIVSDNLMDLRGLEEKFVIRLKEYNSNMFRAQRSFLKDYPQLKANIIAYVHNLKNIDPDDGIAQINIQSSEPANSAVSAEYSEMPDVIFQDSGVKQIKKNPAIAKKVLNDSGYRCTYDPEHVTFTTPKGVRYMEGHHLIPCTVENSENFKSQSPQP